MSTEDIKEALADLEALISANPENADPEVLAACAELRRALASAVPTPPDEEIDDDANQARREGGEGGEEEPCDTRGVKRKIEDRDPKPVNRAPNGERMHPRNVYKEKNPDFGALAQRQPFLKKYLKKRGKGRFGIDFTSWDATKALNRALLMDHYGLVAWDIPEGQLCPPVANRANYIHWLEDLLRLSRPSGLSETTGAHVRGLDIGVGANCVYPLLGASINGWSFVGSDVTDVALRCATENAAANPAVSSLIEIRDARKRRSGGGGGDDGDDGNGDGGGLLLQVVREGESFAFCMCNPPFFESMEEAELNPSTNFGGTPEEMCCEGGEEAFVKRIYDDSLVLRERVYWYTTMCGKKDTWKRLRRLLELRRVPAVRTTEFLQGNTTRWGVAWSFAKEAGNTGATPLQPGGGGFGGAVPSSVKPCYRMTWEMQAGRNSRKGGASEVVRELRLALESAGCAVELPNASDPLKLRCRPGAGGGAANTFSFYATVMQSAPGSLMISSFCEAGPQTDVASQKFFAQAMVAARTRMLA